MIIKKNIFLRILLPIIFISLLLLLSSCLENEPDNRPGAHPYSKWISDDESISFTVDKYGRGIGTMTVGNETINIFFMTGIKQYIEIGLSNDNNEDYNDLIEKWRGDFRKPDEFTAKVIETTYFEPGMKIHFKRIDTE